MHVSLVERLRAANMTDEAQEAQSLQEIANQQAQELAQIRAELKMAVDKVQQLSGTAPASKALLKKIAGAYSRYRHYLDDPLTPEEEMEIQAW